MGVQTSCGGWHCGDCDECKPSSRRHSNQSGFIGFFAIILIVLGLACLAHCEQVATIAFVGDVNFTGRIDEYMSVSHTAWPFEKVKDILSKADYRVCNLEDPAGYGGAKYCEKSVYFKANPKNLDALTYAGFDMVTLANNHALDYGPEVLSQTVRELEKRNIKYMGIDWNNLDPYQPTFATINGVKIAFLGYCNACPEEFGPRSTTAGVNVGMASIIRLQMAQLRSLHPDVDFVVAMPHWGTEYGNVDRNQEFTEKVLYDSGVDLVVGAHPHVLQKSESVIRPNGNRFVVAYSLGNFVFPMRWHVSMDSAILFIELVKDNGKKEITQSWVPVSLDTNRPVPVEPGTERFKRDRYIIIHGYDYPDDRLWPTQGPWQ